MASTVVIDALDRYWNETEQQPEFVTVTERLMDKSFDEYEDEITFVNDRSANTFWRGTTDVRSWKPELKRQDTFETLSGLKIYPHFDKYGNHVLRHFIDNSHNITIRIRAVFTSHGDGFIAECFLNTKLKNNRWQGRKVAEFKSRNCFTELSEQRVTYWCMTQFDRWS